MSLSKDTSVAAKPHAPSCDRNQGPILDILRLYLAGPTPKRVLEIGSGTGQHAVHFGAALPHVTWQTSDQVPYHSGIDMWLQEAGLVNVLPPLGLDVTDLSTWPEALSFEVVFTANTTHIMSEDAVTDMIAGTGRVLTPGGLFFQYGPFNYDGQFSSDSNAKFELWLKEQDPRSGIRDFEWIEQTCQFQGLELVEDYGMPANNQLLVWRKEAI